jgi:hypothetical protein
MRTEKQVVYVPDAVVQEARKRGMTNLSGFVREKLIEFNTKALATASQETAT